MISFDTFKNSIEIIEQMRESEDDLSRVLNCEGFTNFCSPLIEVLIDVLAESVNDKFELIEHYAWELNFGTNSDEEGDFFTDDDVYYLNSIENLWECIQSV